MTCTKNLLTVTFERETIAAEAGLEFAEVRVAPVTRTLECNAVLEYDGNRFARLAPQIGGLVQSVEKDLGDRVEKGDVLAVIVSPAFGAAKAAYLQAVAAEALWEKNHTREKDLLSRGVATERDLLEAETSLAESRIARSRTEQELMGLGLSSEQIDRGGPRPGHDQPVPGDRALRRGGRRTAGLGRRAVRPLGAAVRGGRHLADVGPAGRLRDGPPGHPAGPARRPARGRPRRATR